MQLHSISTQLDQAAIAAGFTKRVYIEGGVEGGEFLVRPETDLDTRFKSWAIDWQQWINVSGFSCSIEEA
jgi:hypothetical protein